MLLKILVIAALSSLSLCQDSWWSGLLPSVWSWSSAARPPTQASSSNSRPILAKPISDNLLAVVANADVRHETDFNTTLANILIPRVPGTASHLQVNEFIKTSFKTLGWTIEEDAFSSNTPLGNKPFRNIIATLNPSACKRLVFACHYDSKHMHSQGRWFLGATDSAVPCAMMIHMARALDDSLKRYAQDNPFGTTLQMIFFDGEEAFVEWSDDDSLYGSRHLAEAWNKSPASPICSHSKDVVSELDRIDLFVLLDLLGAKKPKFDSYFQNTDQAYLRMHNIEKQLNTWGLMRPSGKSKTTNFFTGRRGFSPIQDDHIPFLRKGVRVVHLIAHPFPSVWHTMKDDASALDHPTIRNLISIFQGFLVEYFGLQLQ